MKVKIIILLACLMPAYTFAQIQFESVGTVKPIVMTMGWEGEKGGFVWYKGQSVPIPLTFKSLDIDSSEVDSGQPYFYSYKYKEMYKGKVTGEYGFTEWPRNVDDIYYLRYKDNKKFKFKMTDDKNGLDGKSMILLHGIQVHYYSFFKDELKLVYPNGSSSNQILNKIREGTARRAYIDDYNFDGVDDICFEIMNFESRHYVYDMLIYDSLNKKFNRIIVPKSPECDNLTLLKPNKKLKQISFECMKDNVVKKKTYKFNVAGEMVVVN